MNRKGITTLFFLSALLVIGYFSAICFKMNYPMHLEVRRQTVNHPEFIPQALHVKMASAGFANLVSDFYWLDSIQYIGSNAFSSAYKKYLYPMLGIVTDLNPNFTHPYIVGELLLSTYNDYYEKDQKDEQPKFDRQSVELAQKGIRNNCDMRKVEAIKGEFDLKKVLEDPKYADPCTEPNIPYYLGYIYYWSTLNDGATASKYYKVAAANRNAPPGAKIMAAIMQGKSGDREKAILMFLSLAESLGTKETKQCKDYAGALQKVLFEAYQQGARISSDGLKLVERERRGIIDQIPGESNYSIANEHDCKEYLNKAVRELNLAYLDQAGKEFFKVYKFNAFTPEELFDGKFIDFIPVDFQQYDDQGIIYQFNDKTGNWDVKMWPKTKPK